MFLAILAVFITFLERKLGQAIETPEIYVWATIILKTFKGWFTVTVFICNGAVSDFYIGCFFLFTSMLGAMYFEINELRRPEIEEVTDENVPLKQRLRSVKDKVLLNYFSGQEGYGYRLLAILTVLIFFCMSGVALYSP